MNIKEHKSFQDGLSQTNTDFYHDSEPLRR